MTTEPLLRIEDLHVEADGAPILRGVSLEVGPGEVHTLMGPNGSGKSTLANALLANPAYTVTSGRILLRGEDVTALATDERAARGVFLGFQHPEEIPGVSVLNFLRQAMAVRKGIPDLSVLEVRMALLDGRVPYADLGLLDLVEVPALLQVASVHEPSPAARPAMERALARLVALHPALTSL